MLTDYKIAKIEQTDAGTFVTMEVYEGQIEKKQFMTFRKVTPDTPAIVETVERDVYVRYTKLRTKKFQFPKKTTLADMHIDFKLNLKKDPMRTPIDTQKIAASVSEIKL